MESNKSAGSDLQGGLYLPPSWQALRQQIAYLAQFGGSLQVVQGQFGAGKSTLLNWLTDEPICGDFIVVGAERGQDVGAFLHDLLWQLGLRPGQAAPIGEHIASLRGYVQSLRQEGERVVVAVDDAHWISEAALAAIVSVLQGGGNSGLGLHLILFSEPGLPEKLDRLQLLDVELHDATIPTLSQSEVEQFLYARGMALVSGLEPETARQIWYRSQGIPGAVLKEFEVIGNEAAGTGEERDKPVNWWGLPFGHLAAVVLLIVVLLWAYFGRNNTDAPRNETFPPSSTGFSGDSATDSKTASKSPSQKPSDLIFSSTEEELRSSSNALPAAKSMALNSAEITSTAVAASGDTQASANQATSIADEAEIIQLGAEIETKIEESDIGEQAVVGNGLPEIKADKAESNERQISLVEARQKSVSGVEVSSSPKAAIASEKSEKSGITAIKAASQATAPAVESESGAPEAKGAGDNLRYQSAEQKLKNLPGSGFVIQLMALSDYNKLEVFARSQPNSKNLMIYRAQRNGKLLYILVEGFYADKASASSAVVNLPSSQRKGKPWPKQISVIQRDIAEIR